MKQLSVLFTSLLCSLLLLRSEAFAETLQPIPKLTARVVDQAGILSPEEERVLEDRLDALEREKGAQVVVLTVQTTRPEEIEQFTIRVAESWKIGRKGIDDGAILALAMKDRAMRIEVGYGLEGALTDVVSKRILDDILKPRLQSGAYAAGIKDAVNAIVAVVRGETLPEPTHKRSTTPPETSGNLAIVLLCFTGLFLSETLFRSLGRVRAGVVSSLLVFTLGVFLVSSFVGLVSSAIVFFLTVLEGDSNFHVGGGRSGRGWSGGGWSSGGGGFSGGGGSFGGGGASGRW